MNTSLQELTDKIYAEGVEKGKAEAQQIIAEAERKAAEIVANAEKQAQATLAAAGQKASELDKNTRSELRLFAQQSVDAIKTEVTNLLTSRLAEDSVKAATADKAFMQKIIADLAAQLAKEGSVVIETQQAAELTRYFEANAKDLLDKGVTINQVNGIKTDFTIAPAKGGYKLTFGEKEFEEYFKEFLRPQLLEMLF